MEAQLCVRRNLPETGRSDVRVRWWYEAADRSMSSHITSDLLAFWSSRHWFPNSAPWTKQIDLAMREHVQICRDVGGKLRIPDL